MQILSLAPLSGPGLDLLRAMGELRLDPWLDHVPPRLHSADELVYRLAGVQALIVEADFVPREVFERATLRLLGVCRGDPNNVDIPAATKRNVAVIRTPGRNASAVAELAVGLMFGLLRSVVAADADVRAGRFLVGGKLAQQRFLGRELGSCVVGLVGFGAVGRAVAVRLRALGATVIACDPYGSPDDMRALGVEPVGSLAELAARADIVSIHAALAPETRGLVGADVLAHVRPGSYLVNTARYGIVDEPALLDALADGRLAGAAFDHFENEFLAPDHPLASMSNVILTPHIGGSTRETIDNHTLQIARGFAEVLAGRAPETLANPEVMTPRP